MLPGKSGLSVAGFVCLTEGSSCQEEFGATSWKCSKAVWMWHLGTRPSGGHGSAGLMVGLDDPGGPFRPKGFFGLPGTAQMGKTSFGRASFPCRDPLLYHLAKNTVIR